MNGREIVDFERDVLQASGTTPVLVDFWAPWCGPCRILGPILEKLASEAGGKWDLAKVNVDEHQELAMRYGIQGIPAVKLFHGGEPVAEFVGALPERSVRQWLEQNLPAGSASGVASAREAIAAGREGEAVRYLEDALAEDAENAEARLLLARLLLPAAPGRAAELLVAIPEEDPGHEAAGRLLWLLRLRDRLAQGQVTAGTPGDLDLYRRATDAFFSRDTEAALQGWLELVGRNRALDEDGARLALLGAFEVLGGDHPLTRTYRPRLASLIY